MKTAWQKLKDWENEHFSQDAGSKCIWTSSQYPNYGITVRWLRIVDGFKRDVQLQHFGETREKAAAALLPELQQIEAALEASK